MFLIYITHQVVSIFNKVYSNAFYHKMMCSYWLFAYTHATHWQLLYHGSSYRQVFKNAMQIYSLLRKRYFVKETLLHNCFDLIRALLGAV